MHTASPSEEPANAGPVSDLPAPFDYAEPAELFTRAGMVAQVPSADAPARSQRRNALTYRRFATGAEAVRFAIEKLPPGHLAATVLVTGGDRHEGIAIRDLYASDDYPLPRWAIPSRRHTKHRTDQ